MNRTNLRHIKWLFAFSSCFLLTSCSIPAVSLSSGEIAQISDGGATVLETVDRAQTPYAYIDLRTMEIAEIANFAEDERSREQAEVAANYAFRTCGYLGESFEQVNSVVFLSGVVDSQGSARIEMILRYEQSSHFSETYLNGPEVLSQAPYLTLVLYLCRCGDGWSLTTAQHTAITSFPLPLPQQGATLLL